MPRVLFISIFLLFISSPAYSDRMDSYQIGSHGQGNAKFPPWFKESFLDLSEDWSEARQAGKKGIIIFFSQENCSHCQAFLQTTLSDPSTRQRVQKSYDVIGLDIFSDNELKRVNGTETSIKNFAETAKARFTPTLLFYGDEKRPVARIVGFYPPEKFNQVLDYIDGYHYKKEKLSQYLRTMHQNADNVGSIEYDFSLFKKPPYTLRPNSDGHSKNTLVIFEIPNCNPCQRFHARVLSDTAVRELMSSYNAIQLNALDNTSEIVIPDGRKLTPKQWAEELQLTYDIAAVFFDENGIEVHRADAETGKDRFLGSLQYVSERAYNRHEQFLQWRKENRIKNNVSK